MQITAPISLSGLLKVKMKIAIATPMFCMPVSTSTISIFLHVFGNSSENFN